MFSVEPNYYAIGQENGDFVVIGDNLNTIPSDSIGVYAANNNFPLQHRYDRQPFGEFEIVEQTQYKLTLRPKEETILKGAVYLGGIVSLDGEIVYWVNNTKPLP